VKHRYIFQICSVRMFVSRSRFWWAFEITIFAYRLFWFGVTISSSVFFIYLVSGTSESFRSWWDPHYLVFFDVFWSYFAGIIIVLTLLLDSIYGSKNFDYYCRAECVNLVALYLTFPKQLLAFILAILAYILFRNMEILLFSRAICISDFFIRNRGS